MANKVVAVQLVVVVVVASLSTFLSSVVDAGSCRDFTFGDCQRLDNFETVNDVNDTICQRYCSDVFDTRCTFFVYDSEQQLCEIFDSGLEAFAGQCLTVGGPKSPPQQQCESNPCNKFLEGYCKYDGVVLSRSSTVDAVRCQQDCAAYNGCEYFVYDSSARQCVFYDSTSRDCDLVRGPQKPPIDDCYTL